MERSKISFRARCTTADIMLTVCLDDKTVYHGSLTETPQTISYEFNDSDGNHRLVIAMSGKNETHTKVDTNGNILEDHTMTISDLAFDDIKLGYVFTELAIYEHDFNGSGERTQEKFHGDMGCNGTITLDFISPIYLWLLEHM